VGGLVAFGAYKMSKSDAQKIEEHTGTSPEEMTDEELERAMAELNIEKQYRDDADQEYVDESAPQSGQGADEPDYLDELERLGQLKDSGVISEEEFEAKKKQLLGL
jgi:U3 small nucleolar ribonucleoprotein component